MPNQLLQFVQGQWPSTGCPFRCATRAPLNKSVIRWRHMEELLSLVVRFFGYLVTEIILGTFFYAIGWPFVKVATFGKYPKNEWLSGSRNEAYVCCVGILVFAILLMAVLGQFSA